MWGRSLVSNCQRRATIDMGALFRTLALAKGLQRQGRQGRQGRARQGKAGQGRQGKGRQARQARQAGDQRRAIAGKAARTPAVKTADLYFTQVQKVHG